MKNIIVAATLLASVSASFAIEFDAYRKISRTGMDAAEVLLIAGEPDARQRTGKCETWFYRGADNALEGKKVVVQLCSNKVVNTSLSM